MPAADGVPDLPTLTATDVIIVGGSCSGLVLALELARRGVSFVLLDKSSGPHKGNPDCAEMFGRTICLHSATLDTLERIGMVDQVLACSHMLTAERLVANGKVVTERTFKGSTSQHAEPVVVDQSLVERILIDRINRLGYQQCIKRNVEIDSIHIGEHPDETITVNVRPRPPPDPSQPKGTRDIFRNKFNAKKCAFTGVFLVGCDGVDSTIKKKFAPPRVHHPNQPSGTPGEMEFLVADIRAQWPVPANKKSAQLLLGRNREVVSCVPLGGGNKWRVVAGRRIRPLLTETSFLMDIALPGSVIEEVDWATCVPMCDIFQPTYSWGRVFMCGDAAQMHSPFFDEGINTGIQDASNLAWKLATVVANQADWSLLDTYVTERHQRRKMTSLESYMDAMNGGGLLWNMRTILPTANSQWLGPSLVALQKDRQYPIHRRCVGREQIKGSVPPGSRAPDAKLALVDDNQIRFVRLHQAIARPSHTLLLALRVPAKGEELGTSSLSSASRPKRSWFGGTCYIPPIGLPDPIEQDEIEVSGVLHDLLKLGVKLQTKYYEACRDDATPKTQPSSPITPSRPRTAAAGGGGANSHTSTHHAQSSPTTSNGSDPQRPEHQRPGQELQVLLVFSTGRATLVPMVEGVGRMSTILNAIKKKFKASFEPQECSVDLQLAWDVEGEVLQRYKFNLSPFNAGQPAAFCLIRPDGIIAHHGHPSDASMEAPVIGYFDRYE
ncbi:unnamed protein product [Vitrella brassicaformis CCMP3155]|uniref:FAD-binding domain-containing protein n=1 Tax=Vitrella brassicaformis (strain CCMP3155) TaxID=1169540 RepID=A0A0G4GAN6_VITBC|nr:unnamed protein product [Vitrella brassicaformis CCMP3155]|eukprot:CEM25794.1 unnamed protein product [Vitrella brassicaformis CCMP3155]